MTAVRDFALACERGEPIVSLQRRYAEAKATLLGGIMVALHGVPRDVSTAAALRKLDVLVERLAKNLSLTFE